MRFRLFLSVLAMVLPAAALAQGQSDTARCAEGHGESAIAACSEIIATGADADVSWAYFDRGRAYLHERLYGSAVSDFDDFLRLNKDNAGALELRGRAYLAMSDYGRAADDFERLAAMQPASADPWREACWARAASGHALDDALADCDHALALKANDAPALEARCFVQLRNAAYAAAIADCSAALAADPQRAASLYLRGLAKSRAKQAGADADLAAARMADPVIADIFANYGVK